MRMLSVIHEMHCLLFHLKKKDYDCCSGVYGGVFEVPQKLWASIPIEKHPKETVRHELQIQAQF